MRYSGKPIMNLCLMVVSAGVVIIAMKWPLKASLFPVAIGIPVFFIAVAELLLSFFGKEEITVKQSAVDFKLSENVDRALAIRRTFFTFTWIIGFFLLILFFSFSIAIPLFIFLYLKLQSREGWGISLILTGLGWIFFYGLFVWLLRSPFPEGWALQGLRMLGIE